MNTYEEEMKAELDAKVASIPPFVPEQDATLKEYETTTLIRSEKLALVYDQPALPVVAEGTQFCFECSGTGSVRRHECTTLCDNCGGYGFVIPDVTSDPIAHAFAWQSARAASLESDNDIDALMADFERHSEDADKYDAPIDTMRENAYVAPVKLTLALETGV